jgi:hypothetical protein
MAVSDLSSNLTPAIMLSRSVLVGKKGIHSLSQRTHRSLQTWKLYFCVIDPSKILHIYKIVHIEACKHGNSIFV